ncbi:MAG: metallophosphoesterase [Bacteroidales bacterium]|nr:metallophosphoesterase [Bacteroidales bacterium]
MKFRLFVLYSLLCGVLPDVVICCAAAAGVPLLLQLLICLPTAILLACLPFIGTGRHYTDSVRLYSYMMFIFGVPKLVFTIFWAAGRFLLGVPEHPALWIALAAGAAVSLFFLAMVFYVSRRIKVVDVELAFEGLPAAFDGLRICQLSDIHLGSFGRRAPYVRRVMEKALSQQADLILFTGDLVNFEAREADYYKKELTRLHAPMGVIAIRGNHDYLMHGPLKGEALQADADHLLDLERSLGWTLLLNDSVILRRGEDAIAVAGVENVSTNPYFSHTGGDLKKALEGIPEGLFTILMSHDPTHWRREILPTTDIPLTLSGHTHGLKYKLIGFKPSHWRLPESAGVYTEGAQRLHVSGGLGSAFAFRIGGFPKIEIIKLTRYGKLDNDRQPDVRIGNDG